MFDTCPQRKGYHSEAMSAGKADALHTLLERLLENTPGRRQLYSWYHSGRDRFDP